MQIKNIVAWVLTVVLSALYIWAGHTVATRDMDLFDNPDYLAEKAVVISVEDAVISEYSPDGVTMVESYSCHFRCEIIGGEDAGREVTALQTADSLLPAEAPVAIGDKIIIYNYPAEGFETEWFFGSYVRANLLAIFAGVFFALLLLFGRIKGLNTVLSLSFTCMAIFMVYIPAVLGGFNVYICTVVTCLFVIVMTLLLTNGLSPKTLATILGCAFGFTVAAVLSVLFDSLLRLTGLTDEHTIYLTYLGNNASLDLNAVIFGAIVIGALGAVMDVAMDIASALHELYQQAPTISFKELVKSGINIGRDVMGTMANTLVLAYIGSSLAAILLLIAYAASLVELLNREVIVVEILQALIGSTAILLTIPLTAVVCGLLYIRKKPPVVE